MPRPKGSKNKISKKIKLICGVCKTEFEVIKARIRKGKYCSYKCAGISRRGLIPWNKDKPWSKKIKEKFSKARKGRFGGSNHPNWKGGKYKDTHGYVFIYNPNHPFCNKDGCVREHRLVIEQYIKRYLKRKEHCHHLGKRDDNRPHMLMAFKDCATHNKFEHNKPINPSDILFDGRKF